MLERAIVSVKSGHVNPAIIQALGGDGGTERAIGLFVTLEEPTPQMKATIGQLRVHELADLEPEESASFGPVLERLLAAMRAALRPERIYVFQQTVNHLIACQVVPSPHA